MRALACVLGLSLAGCLGGGSGDVSCDPEGEVLATARELDDSALAARAGSIYWVDKSEETAPVLRRMDPAGDIHDLVALTAASEPWEDSWLSVDDTHVYWLGYGALRRVPIGGGAAQDLVVADAGASLALDADSAWIVRSEGGETVVLRVAKDGTSRALVMSDLGEIRAVAVDDDRVYAAAVEFTDDAHARVYALDKDAPSGSPAMIVATEPGAVISQIAVDDSYVYAATAGTVTRAPLAGGAPEVIGRNVSESFLIAFAVDGGEVFWTDRAGWLDANDDSQGPFTCGAVYRATGPSGELVAAGQHQPSTIAVDRSALLWLALGSRGDAAIMRAMR